MGRCAARHNHGSGTATAWGACRLGRRAVAWSAGRRSSCDAKAARLLTAVVLVTGALLLLGVDTTSAQTVPPPSSAAQIAQGDARVAEVLDDVEYEVSVSTWGGGDAGPSGATLIYTWAAANARSAAGVWPLLQSTGSAAPSAPYDPVEHRLRVDDLTSLRVDVLPAESRVLQIRPLAAETEYVLLEETWPPFSSVPWLTEHPWILAPLYMLAALWITLRAWRRSRAWNRRLPSMTRHDRQFILRLSVILFLLLSIVWQVYESVVAAQSPSASPGGMEAGDLTALPILLFPPALFFAALALEFSPAAHRVAWGLVAVLAAAGSVYFLAAAMTGTVGNLNLSYYILLGVLALVTAPRAFSAGRMGWSRKGMSRYA